MVKVNGRFECMVSRSGVPGANPEDGEIQAVLLTENNISDDQAVKGLLDQVEQTILDFAADGAYDKRKVYDSLNAHSPKVNILIPPRKNARIWKHGNTKTERLKRDENLRAIRKDGRKEWRKNSGYHVRFIGGDNYVSPQNHLWQRTLGSSPENTDNPSLGSLCRSQ